MTTTHPKAAHVIKVDGSITAICFPPGTSRKKPTLADYYEWIGCDTIESVRCKYLDRTRIMVVDENGKNHRKPHNAAATAMFHAQHPGVIFIPGVDDICGTAVVLVGFAL